MRHRDQPRRGDPLDQPLQLFSGKGGVGKSSVVGAVALAAARRGRRPLVVELGGRGSVAAVLGVTDVGFELGRAREGVLVTTLDADSALLSYLEARLRSARIARSIAANPSLGCFFRATPAVYEVLVLARLDALLEQARTVGAPFDVVLVDLEATGHAVMLLETPSVLSALVGNGPLGRLLSRTASRLRDPDQTRLNVVTLPQRLVVDETRALCDGARDAGVALGSLYVNRMPGAVSAEARALLPTLRERARNSEDSRIASVLDRAQALLVERDFAEAELERLVALGAPTVCLPNVPSEDVGVLADGLLGSWGSR